MKTITFFIVIFILTTLLGFSQGTLDSGLVAYYPFSGNANDSSANAYHGTVNGATLTTDRFGQPNAAYSFNGSGDNITLANSSNLNITNQLSISVWVKTTNPGHGQNIIGSSSYLDRSYILNINGSDGQIEFAVAKSVPNLWDAFIESQDSITDNIWHHIVGIFQGADLKLYADTKSTGVVFGSSFLDVTNISNILIVP
ncbi:MAG: LamG domain-containing protein [Bacteroidetes bacterium]|nr:LamG domain-containing protein [Bacteroidota bacterium]